MSDPATTITEVSESDAITTYRVTKKLWSGATRFQSVEIADSEAYGRLLFLDGELQSASADEAIYHECLVHPVMSGATATCGSALSVLVVGGGEGATVREVLKWGPARVDWVDIDGELVALCAEHLGWSRGAESDPRVTFYAEDIQTVLDRIGAYDVIILDLPDPDGETGYLYSPIFWTDMHAHLVPGGRLVTHCGPVRPYGSVGEGVQRVMATAAAGGMRFAADGFYHIGIPSFQGDWGFLMYLNDAAEGPFHFVRAGGSPMVPSGAVVMDDRLLHSWAYPTCIWRNAAMSVAH
jgi:spermidine synthase